MVTPAEKGDSIDVYFEVSNGEGKRIIVGDKPVKLGITLIVLEEYDGTGFAPIVVDSSIDVLEEEVKIFSLDGKKSYFVYNDFTTFDNLMDIKSNFDNFVNALEKVGLRLTTPSEFRGWHTKHCAEYKADDNEPEHPLIAGGWSHNHEGEPTCLSAGYADPHINGTSPVVIEFCVFEDHFFRDAGSREGGNAILLHYI